MNTRTPLAPALADAVATCAVDSTGATPPPTSLSHSGLHWHNRFAAMGAAFHTALQPTSLPNPYWVSHSAAVAVQLGLNPHWLASDEALQVFTGNAQLPGMQPLASVYSGHQFGVWAGQLGDGRAILLGETASGLELQLKGAGPTPYSRRGDGRAVLRSSIREFLASGAMQGLGIPTTQALCITGSHAPVQREETETAAVVTRVAPSFIRFGHFEHFAASGQLAELRQLADHVIDQYYPACRTTAQFNGIAYAALLAEVALRTATLMAQWQAVGFCHGVMNTDNMSILGLTIDYGPFQFLDAFVPGHICNHSDSQGRYAFNQQPQVAYWNLFCLGQALLPLIKDTALATAALDPYRTAFSQGLEAAMRAKLGWADTQPDDAALIDALLQLLANNAVDYTIFWRTLSEYVAGGPLEAVRDLVRDRNALDAWMLLYSERSLHTDRGHAALLMLKTNPRFILRNHLAEEAIAAAKTGDFSRVATLQQLLDSPYDTHPGFEVEAGFPPDWASTIEISCSS